MYDPEDWQERRERWRETKLWAQAATAQGMNYALTLNPDMRCVRKAAAEQLIDDACRRVFKEANKFVRGLSNNKAVIDGPEVLDFVGMYELFDRTGLVYPHVHLAIALRPDEDKALCAFLNDRWGLKADYAYFPARRPLFKRPHSKPEWHLEPIWGMTGWMSYIRKEGGSLSQMVLPAQFQRNLHPAKAASPGKADAAS